jgi:hypothetical protein
MSAISAQPGAVKIFMRDAVGKRPALANSLHFSLQIRALEA